MDFRSWSWAHVMLAVGLYWVFLAAGWWLHTARPSRQAKARAAATLQVLPGPGPGEELHVYSGTTNLGPAILLALAPPLFLVVLRALS